MLRREEVERIYLLNEYGMKETKDTQKTRKFIIKVTLIMIALIIIIFLLIRYLGRIENKEKIPTSNVDIFDIIFENNEKSKDNDTEYPDVSNNQNNNSSTYVDSGKRTTNISRSNRNNKNSTKDSNDDNNSGTTNNNKDNNNDENNQEILVYDEEHTEYSKDTELNIFKQTAYHVAEGKIAPTEENSYQFVIRNNNDFNIKYSLEMFETNKYNINMKYRLKLNGNYVIGNDNEYVSAEQLDRYDIGLASNTYDVYTLDWKWIESSNDTHVGTTVDANYKLNLKISATGE